MKTKYPHKNKKSPFSDKESFVRSKREKQVALNNSFFQPKLQVGDPSSTSEKEADNMADHVAHSSNRKTGKNASENSFIQRQSEKEEEPATKRVQRQAEKEEEPATKIQRQAEKEEEPDAKLIQQQAEKKEEPAAKIQRQTEKEEEPAAKLDHSLNKKDQKGDNTEQGKTGDRDSKIRLENMIKETKGFGMALPNDIRSEMEKKFKADFSKVRIHTGNKSEIMTNILHAQAFTHGYDIYFNTGKYLPYSSAGKHLLAHELTHVVQQKGHGK